jgi:hypothetical protein
MRKTKISFRQLFKATALACFPTVRRSWRALLALTIIHVGIDQYSALASRVIQERGREEIGLLVFTSLVQFILDLLWSGAWLLVVSRAADTVASLTRNAGDPEAPEAQPSFVPSFMQDYPQVLIEGIRVLAAMIFRLPFLVIPALIEYVRLVFVPYVVLFDSAYKRGEVDALKQSRRLVRGRFVFLSTLVSIQPLIVLLLALFKGDEAFIWEKPLEGLISVLLTFLLDLFFGILVFFAYRACAQLEKPDAVAS